MKELLPTFNNRAGKVGYAPGKKAERCSNFLNKLVFTWQGNVILCCNDWEEKVVFGNVIDKPLSLILADKKYREYYYAHRDGKAKDLPLCRECNLI
jgi:radical SAM protein with 4Fe4S-binding SPASM domain